MDVYQFLAEREQAGASSSANKAINDHASGDNRTQWWAVTLAHVQAPVYDYDHRLLAPYLSP
ncbi:hypothetical protein KDA_36840 [Dictyobacter alpinus]|uniref:Uncharacterized protein n=1 Tax=Dictyobacter alpinus TaxID=2014873 RepID=A0A402BA73_9CHLR|nr:hypothetical protein [Dictyobacter alpinus]GCE28200.1 hypothetical protein KDA_36840 [Dictyobacter alpinus]